ncbi:D-glycero-beta-D-manno-heptose 1-phosphate adenylyltransferase [Frankia sp. CcWB2]
MPSGRGHVAALQLALDGLDVDRLAAWGTRLAEVLAAGGRLLAAGNGGSAAEAQHLTAELVGRFRDDRAPMSAIPLHADTSSLTAIGNDFGYDDVFARQVRAHGRPGDVLMLLSTSGRSANLLHAADAARELGLTTWALVGRADSPLAAACDEIVATGRAGESEPRENEPRENEPRESEPSTATVQETHLVAVHVLCAACDVALGVAPTREALPRSAASSASTPQSAAPPECAAPPSPRRPLVVVGDTLLDRDLVGRVERLAPDAPVPVLDQTDDLARPGGAGLAALLAARDGHDVVLVTALADDEGERRLAALLADASVTVVDLGLDGPTPQKIRMRTGTSTLLRLDRGTGDNRGTGGAVRDTLPEAGRRALAAARAILVADYGRGLARHRPVTAALAGRARRVPLVWDPHPRGDVPPRGATLVTPNLAEARWFTRNATVRRDPIAEATDRGRRLVAHWGAAGVAITLGERGALLVGASDTPPLIAPATPVAADPCGAGHRFAATATALLGAGALPSETVVAATRAASDFLAAGGVSTLARKDGGGDEGGTRDGDGGRGGDAGRGGNGARGGGGHDLTTALDATTALDVVRRARARGSVVVATGGCFDLLHAGHVSVLAAARRLGDCLVVCLNSDASVRRLKGPDRPLVSQADRAAVLLGLGSVDAVAVFDDDTPARLLGELRPDVFAKGGDYAVADLPEAAVVASWQGQAVVLPYLEGRSTTKMIREAVRRGGT